MLVNEEDVPPNLRCNDVKYRKQFLHREKRGRSDGNKTSERMTIKSEPSGIGAQDKGTGL